MPPLRSTATALLSASILACGPIAVPVQAQVQRCPQPCPSSCSQSCLPSGYCAEINTTAKDLGLSPLQVNGSWTADIPGFPPGADIAFTIHAGFSVVGIDPSTGGELNIGITINGNQNGFYIANAFDSFPVWSSYQAYGQADAAGALHLVMLMWMCKGTTLPLGSPEPVCTIDETSTFTATLANTAPWTQAPPCEP